MIDYIRQLLEQQLEREEEDGAWETGPVRVPLPVPGKETDGQREENREQVILSGLEGEPGTGAGLIASESRSGGAGGGGTRRWAAGREALRLAGERRPGGGPEAARALQETARELDQAVRISLAGLPAAEGPTRVVTLEPPERGQSTGADALHRLDRLVRRDARRFDGGFQLL